LFWRNAPWWANHSTVIFVIFAGISLLAFTKDFLNTSKYFPVINKSIYFFAAFWGVLFILSFTNYPFYAYIVRIVNYSAVVLVIFIFILTCLSFKKMFVEAFYFFLSFIFLLTGIVLYVMKNAGVLPENDITQYGVKLGFGVQVLMLCFAVTYRFRRLMEMTNKELEERVKKRTEKIQIQNREIILQRDYLNYQKEKLEVQRKEIINSIEYAQRIQNALLPTERFISKVFLDGFLLFKPRDIVSGDFYWISKKRGLTILVAADCTGHGVPGAFMSMLGISFLNEIVNRIVIYNEKIKPHEVLNELTNYITGTLTFNDHKENVKDGIDMGICIYNHANSLLYYAGARRPLYHMRDTKLTTYKGDRLTVGYNFNRQSNFTTHRIEIKEGDIIYLFSDGYIDQIGEKSKKTFRTQRFKNLLKSIYAHPMEEQQKMLEDTFNKWKGKEEQIDDVLVIGVKF
jgi:serine phosphatase RsbU (regulator of sigma subunit)